MEQIKAFSASCTRMQRRCCNNRKNIATYAQKARDSKLEMNDLDGGVFTISNGETLWIMLSTPIINFPQPAILDCIIYKIEPLW